jgi:Cytochrome P460
MSTRAIIARAWSASMLAACTASCSSGPTDVSDGGAAGVLVFASAFKDFHSWDSTPGVGPPDAAADLIAAVDGGPHSLGPMTSYINKKPPPGSTSFPDGTIIVKEVNGGDLTTRKIFAMEKRGGDFDQTGAVGWEWFELTNIDADNVLIVWRGNGPPNGETYGGNPATCNDCHIGAKDNDYVWTKGFTLSSF